MLARTLIIVGLLQCVLCAVYFKEEFLEECWRHRWVQSTYSRDLGKWVWTAGKFYNDPVKDKGIKTSHDAKFFSISAKFARPLSNAINPMVIQFQVKHEQNIDCGGGYVKLLSSDVDQTNFNSDTPFKIMFGPDICGQDTRKVHVIFNHKGQIKKAIPCKADEFSHVYTLIVRPDNTYEVLIDNERVQGGYLEDDWEYLPPKKIPDPDVVKPADWDDRENIDDMFDEKPEDWDDTMDVEWRPRQIANLDYKGKWNQPMIDNPEYSPEYPELYRFADIGAIGFDLWQVKSGSIFDNVFVGDDPAEARDFAEATWRKASEGEKRMKRRLDEEAQRVEAIKLVRMRQNEESWKRAEAGKNIRMRQDEVARRMAEALSKVAENATAAKEEL